MFTYAAKIVHVVDGDTVDLTVDLGFRVKFDIRARVYGINAPEVSTTPGRMVRDWLREHVKAGDQVTIQTFKAPGDKYGRWLAKIEHPEIGDIAKALIERNYAVDYFGTGEKLPIGWVAGK
jgi:micrococcal nuclease